MIRTALLVVATCSAVSLADVDPQPETPTPTTQTTRDAGKPFWEWQRATDDWAGVRPMREDRGLSINANLTADAASNFRGGANTNGGAFMHLFQLNATLDTMKAAGLAGGTFFINAQTVNGDSIANDAGDVQGISSIEAPGRTQISEVWYEQKLLADKLSVRLGKIDANTLFALPANAGEFVNPSFGFSPTIVMPSYPDPAFGGTVFVTPNEHWYAGVGVFDGAAQEGIPTGSRGPSTLFGAPSDLEIMGEAGYKWTTGRLGLGVWHHTGTFARFDGGTDDGTTGVYAVLDQKLNDDFAGFVQLGYADPELMPITGHLGLGVTWTGPIPSRKDDITGVAVTLARLSDDAGFDDRCEIITELFYKLQLTPFFSLKPDVQYVHHPGGIGSQDDAIVGLVRLSIDF